MSARFPLGRTMTTPGVSVLIEDGRLDSFDILCRHAIGDWGDVDDEDQRMNDEMVRSGGRLVSAYHASDGTRVWVITEADRSVTTILLPSEY